MTKRPDLNKLRIIHYPDPVLRARAAEIKEVDTFLQEMAARMKELTEEANGAGLAGNQVGWPFRMVVVNAASEESGLKVFINPVIIEREGLIAEEEGCLSVPAIFAKVRRAEKVRVRATLPDGEVVEMDAEGLAARAWQHELDHLDGFLFLDRLRPSARVLIQGRLRYLEREYEKAQGEAGKQP